MTIAILDPFSGIAGDMTLGALVDCGLEAEWLRALPQRLGLTGVKVSIRDVSRGHLACKKIEFEIPPQPHGRHLSEIRSIVARSEAPPSVRSRADAAFVAIATVEGAMHGIAPERVHLHEVGAVDAILDIVGSIWGFVQLGVDTVYCGPIALGDGTVDAAHGTLPVPAPATLKLLEGHAVRPGPPGAGELVTPTGAALVRVLSSGPPPSEYIPHRSGLGAGTKEFPDRANALRLILATPVTGASHSGLRGPLDASSPREPVTVLAADIDDLGGEYVAAAADALRAAGALDVVLLATTMKKGRPGTRIEVLSRPSDADHLEALLLSVTTTLGVRRLQLDRRVLPRDTRAVVVLGHRIAVKVATLPDGTHRAKPEFDDVNRAAGATGRPASDIFSLATEAARTGQFVAEAGETGAASAAPGPRVAQDGHESPNDHPHDPPHDPPHAPHVTAAARSQA
jgi:pyridinium-3,5-bisthiocarboxylic acid mononucleotide nickel chelatase